VAVLVAVETLAIVLLTVLVAGLLRSHADILRALHELGAGVDRPGPGMSSAGTSGLLPLPRSAATADAFDVVGMNPDGDSVAIGVVGHDRDTLLAFLSTSCLTCAGFWQALKDPRTAVPGDARLVIVTKGPEHESEARVAELAPPRVLTVLSDSAWQDYGVPVAPYFIHVRASGQVAGEGAAASWEQVVNLLDQALADDASAVRRRERGEGPGPGESRADPGESRADRELAAAGIGPGDPSLYPTVTDPPHGTVPE